MNSMIIRSLLLLLLTPLITSCAKAQRTQLPPKPASPALAKPVIPANMIHLEAENADMTGNSILMKRSGFSGTGYVGSFEKEGAKIVWIIPKAHAGLYEARLRYCAPFGEKGYDLLVNGTKLSGTFPGTGDAFATNAAGKVELKEGANAVEIDRGWGYFDIDALDLAPAAALQPPAHVPETLSDSQATTETHTLMHRLVSLYGTKTLSGQYNLKEAEYVKSVTGKTPAILGGDFMDYSPSRLSHGSKPEVTTEELIAAAKAGQIVTVQWHWNAPADLLDAMITDKDGKSVDARWYKGFYTNATTFDVKKALDNPASPDYKLLLRDMDAIAVQLQKFQDAGVPVLWRPLHEAEGGWFWWGAKGPEPFKKLWRLMRERLTNVHHLHNLIWVYSSGTKPEWYPGDDVVDVVGIDEYPPDVTDPLSSQWDTLQKQYGGRKLVALTEFGGVPDIEKMHRYGVFWAYFASWAGDLGPHKMSPEDLKRLYNEPLVITSTP